MKFAYMICKDKKLQNGCSPKYKDYNYWQIYFHFNDLLTFSSLDVMSMSFSNVNMWKLIIK